MKSKRSKSNLKQSKQSWRNLQGSRKKRKSRRKKSVLNSNVKWQLKKQRLTKSLSAKEIFRRRKSR